MSDKQPKKKGGAGRIVGRVIGVVLAAVFVALIVAANVILPNYTQVINSYLGVEQGWDNSGAKTEGLDLEYNKADHKSREELADAEAALDEKIAGEGIVLLENTDNALPLAEGTTLSFVSGNARSLGAGAAGILASTMGVEGETVDAVTPAMEAAGLPDGMDLSSFSVVSVPITSGLGEIGGFAQSLDAIARHLGMRSQVSHVDTDVCGCHEPAHRDGGCK